MPPPESGAGASPLGPDRLPLGEAFAWLDRHVNLEAIERGAAGRAGVPTLDRIRALCSALGDPQASLPIVHVTGTNGKGSTTRIAAALLEARGLSVGTFTSPHLERLNERITSRGEAISDADLLEALVALEPLERFLLARDPAGSPPTWFELLTAAAFRYFADEALDAAVVEVGLGGRYDATNVADGQVAVVTNVELDHVEILGNTREAIAGEKAGIVKPGSIAVVGETDPGLVDIFAAEARAVGADLLWRRGEEFACTANALAHGGRLLDLRTPGADYAGLYLPLAGAHQGENAACALAAAEAFFGAPFPTELVEEAFASVRVPGRLEVIGRRPVLLLDVAHNVAGAEALGHALAEDFAVCERIWIAMGCLRGRDPRQMLEALGPERVAHVAACPPPSPRAQPARAVAEGARALGLAASEHESVEEALGEVLHRAAPGDLVLVTGSSYVVGAAPSAARRLVSLGP